MRNYMKADLYRIFTEKLRWLLLTVMLLILMWLLYRDFDADPTAATFLRAWTIRYGVIMIFLVPILELIAVYRKDQMAKTVQIAVGVGIPRWQTLLCKDMEYLLLYFLDGLWITLPMILMGILADAHLTSVEYSTVFIGMASNFFGVAINLFAASIVLQSCEKLYLGIAAYFLMAFHVLENLTSSLLLFTPLAALHLENYMPENLTQMVKNQLFVGKLHIPALLGIFLYCLLPYLLTVALYEKRELEF